ncbi:MAG TPA: ATP synthase F1 subunit gamma [Candidatus Paceibacterota bacterium]|nr:ATP synthase F1 subunit gamma [Verrucomicrobiota bacterium]HRY51146.1 ATP synthase F1 subunit gamma [Candidatus Paceibacterota bacterium]HSA01283.1 ATP synthase F1 subunit gamma [Candidatus Paceibacterota bacterium]
MPSPRDIRRRIKSIRNTAQITKAMQMVAASKMRRAQQAALAGRAYAAMMQRVLDEVTPHAGDFAHPLMEVREVRKRALVVVSPDRGLCGSLNSTLLREVNKLNPSDLVFVAVGRKVSQFIGRTRRHLAAEFPYQDVPKFAEARAVARFAKDLFLKREVDQVDVLFTYFVSTLSQRPELRPLLPVGEITSEQEQEEQAKLAVMMKGATEFAFEPSAARVFEAMLPHYLDFQIYQVLLEAKASEHSARMVAMKNATDNAQNLIHELTLKYNKSRQAMITKELLEITTASMAME